MSTYTNMVSAINNEVDPGGTQYNTSGGEIQTHIKSAVKYYKRSQFRFNEGRITFSTVADTEAYDFPSSGDETLLTVNTAYLQVNSRNYKLEYLDFETFERIKVGSSVHVGRPDFFSFFADQVYLYPIPSAVYTVIMHGIKDLGDPDTVNDSAWFDEAEELIRSRARYTLYRDVFHDADMAANALAAEKDVYWKLKQQQNSYVGSQRVRPWN